MPSGVGREKGEKYPRESLPHLKVTSCLFWVGHAYLLTALSWEGMSTTWSQSVPAQECPKCLSAVQARRSPEHYREWLVCVASDSAGLRASASLLPPFPFSHCLCHLLAASHPAFVTGNQFFCWTDSAPGYWPTQLKVRVSVFRTAKELPGLRIPDPRSCGQGQRSLPTSGAWLPASSTRPWTAPSK